MRVAHEAPLDIIRRVQSVTDYDYALVHLFDESEDYHWFFQQAVEKGRYVILDNSIFELGVAFDTDKFAEHVRALKPSAYIVPDVLESMAGTIANYLEWETNYDSLPGEKIGVVQGSSYEEVVECYKFMSEAADKIAISFDYSFFQKEFPDKPTKYHSWMLGRKKLIYNMLKEGIINKDKPHHLLGCGLPQEFAFYKDYAWIDTIDTSNPVVHGMLDIKYEKYPNGTYGLEDKVSTKLFTMIESSVANQDAVFYNISKFRQNIT